MAADDCFWSPSVGQRAGLPSTPLLVPFVVDGWSRDSLVELPLGPQPGPRPVEPGASWSLHGLSTFRRSTDNDDDLGLKSCSSEEFIL